MFKRFNRWYFFVLVLWRFIHPKPLQKTRFYDNRDRKSVISQNLFKFLEFKLDPYPKCGHCASVWIYALSAYHDSSMPKITKKKRKKMEIFDKNCVFFYPLGVEIELWRIYPKRCARSTYVVIRWPKLKIPNLFLKTCD